MESFFKEYPSKLHRAGCTMLLWNLMLPRRAIYFLVIHSGLKPTFHAPMCWFGMSKYKIFFVFTIWSNNKLACGAMRPVANGQYEPIPSDTIPSVSMTLGFAYPRGAITRQSHASAGGMMWNRPKTA